MEKYETSKATVMIVESLKGEFLHEAENTRKLLELVPDSALEYRPAPHLWSIGELSSHIAEIYNWYPATFEMDHMKMEEYAYEKGDISTMANIRQKFEENLSTARSTMDKARDEQMMTPWVMSYEGKQLMPPMPRVQVVRAFLMNHLYHHRGELIAHLRASGNKVPGLYGPTYEDQQNM